MYTLPERFLGACLATACGVGFQPLTVPSSEELSSEFDDKHFRDVAPPSDEWNASLVTADMERVRTLGLANTLQHRRLHLDGLTAERWNVFEESFPAVAGMENEYQRLRLYSQHGVPPPKVLQPQYFSVQRPRSQNPSLVRYHVALRRKEARVVIIPSTETEVLSDFPFHASGAHLAKKRGSQLGRLCWDCSHADSSRAWTPNDDFNPTEAGDMYGDYTDPDIMSFIQYFFACGGTRGTFMAKTDVKSAFERLPLSDELARCCVLHIDGYYVFFAAALFGHAVLPYAFLNISRVVEGLLRARGFTVIMKTDDLIMFGSASACLKATSLGESMFRTMLGPNAVNLKKRCQPATVQEILGWVVDTDRLVIRLEARKLRKAWFRLFVALAGTRVSVASFRSSVGFLRYLSAIVLPLRPVLSLFNELLGRTQFLHRSSTFELPEEVKYALALWRVALVNRAMLEIDLRHVVWIPRFHAERPMLLCTDASLSGGGGFIVIGDAKFRASWTWPSDFQGERRSSGTINALEFVASVLLLFAARHRIAEVQTETPSILLKTDNVSNVRWFGKVNSRPRKELRELVVKASLLQGVLFRRLRLVAKAEHLPGEQNAEADELSRRGCSEAYFSLGLDNPLRPLPFLFAPLDVHADLQWLSTTL